MGKSQFKQLSNIDIDVEKDFLANVEYLKSLVKELNSKPSTDYDSNLVYEAVYADMYITDMITKVKSPSLVMNLNDIRTALNIVLSGIPSESVLEVRASQNYVKLLKTKYSNIDEGSYTERKAYQREETPEIAYLRNRYPVIVVSFIAIFLLLFGIPRKVSNLYYNVVSKEVESYTEVTEESNATDSEDSFFDNVSSPTHIAEEELGVFCNVVNLTLLSVLCWIAVVPMVTMGLDLLYLSTPIIREVFDRTTGGKRLISVTARGLMEVSDESVIRYKIIRKFDRISRNKLWLSSMLENLRSLDVSSNPQLQKLRNELENIEKVLTEKRLGSTKRYYMNVAKIEFLHDRYLSLTNG